jgi:hypothetical protein
MFRNNGQDLADQNAENPFEQNQLPTTTSTTSPTDSKNPMSSTPALFCGAQQILDGWNCASSMSSVHHHHESQGQQGVTTDAVNMNPSFAYSSVVLNVLNSLSDEHQQQQQNHQYYIDSFKLSISNVGSRRTRRGRGRRLS